MAKYTDADGNEIDAFTQAEIDAQKKQWEEDYKKANPVQVVKTADELAAEKVAADAAAKAASEPLTVLQQQLAEVQTKIRKSEVDGFARQFAGNDPAKQIEYKAKFDRLTGYANTPEGDAERATDAARLIGVNVQGFDVGSISGTSGGRNIDGKGAIAQTEADKTVQSALGITAEDVKKFGGVPAEVAK